MIYKKYVSFVAFFLFILLEVNAQKQYKNLVMEGGGIKGIAYGGALAELESRGVLQNITRVAGTSAGAIQACLVALGFSAEEISTIIAETPVESFNDDGFVVRGSKRLLKQFGWFRGDTFLQKLEELIYLRTGNANLTFSELHQLASAYPFRDLYVTGCNLSDQKVEIFSYETYPAMRIADAVRISMSIPLYYRALWVTPEGKVIEEPTASDACKLFVDGGVLMNFPINVFDNSRYMTEHKGEAVPVFNEETLGFRLDRCEQIDHEINHQKGNAPFEINDFGSYMSALSSLIMRNATPPSPRDAERTIFINDHGMSPRVRKVAEDEKEKMMLSGHHAVCEFFLR